jgi:hypothetical protein
MAKEKKFPDLSGDGEVTKKDILIGRGVIDKKDTKSKFMGGGIAYKGGGRTMLRKGGKV